MPSYEKWSKIMRGSHKPDEAVKWENNKELEKKATERASKWVPDFWLTISKNVDRRYAA